MNLSRGEVVPIKIPFQQAQGAKIRNARSTARVHKLAVLPKDAIKRRIGVLTPDHFAGLGSVLCRAFCPLST